MIGQTVLHYKIVEKLGEGGMGEVYKAQDTKLDRFVALKFLSSSLTASDADKARFVQEAKAASALNHANVCTIYDIQEYEGDQGGKKLFIVMEFVDGETLRDRKTNLSVKQVLEIGAQAAEGLAAAHEKGIVHRDIKPENIMLRKDGRIQIMDFGLAKLYAGTEASRLTKAGTMMGTIGYMSPEQVQGQDVDHRSDIFSLGVVLYELLAGESPFKGVHETAVLYEIVNVDPEPISVKIEGSDLELDRILFECLEKDKDERYQSARELAKDLKRFKRDTARQRQSRVSMVRPLLTNNTVEYASGSSVIGQTNSVDLNSVPARNLSRRVLYSPKFFWSGSAILLIILALLIAFPAFKKSADEKLEIKSTILAPQGVTLVNTLGSNVTISPGGRFVSFVGADSSGTTKLWIRPTNSLTARPLTNVTNEAYPFWSQDDKYIAYFDSHKLMKVSLNEGTSLPICDAPSGRGGTWNQDGIILFAPTPTGGLFKVSSSGGTPEAVIKSDTSTLSLRWPHFLPDGKHFLYSTQNSQSGSSPPDEIYVGSLNDTKGQPIIHVSSNSQYANGYIFYVRQSILLAQQFSPGSLKLSGDAMPVAENLQYYDIRISGTFSVSTAGTIIYQENNPDNERAVLFDTKGNVAKPLFNKKVFSFARFSPDGKKIAFDSNDPAEKNIDVWTYDIQRNVTARLTFEPAVDFAPVWTPDGKQIAYSSNPGNGSFNTYIKNSDGSGQAVILLKSSYNNIASDFSSDGKYILLSAVGFGDKNSGFDLIVLSRKGENPPTKYLVTNFNEIAGKFSPNMKWVAYASDESGKNQTYIAPFGAGSGKWQISVDGGSLPFWMDNGKKVFYFTNDNKILGVDVNESGSSLSPGRPYVVFSSAITISKLFDINKSGTSILAAIPNNKNAPSPITLITNWNEETKGNQ
jgi:eukaryotic-like serine/threonine-protein kinase